MRNGGAAPDPSTQFSLFRLYMIEHPTFHSAQDDEMRRGGLKTRETLIQSLSDFTLEFLYMTRNSLTRIASYLRKAMTKSCIKILVKSDSAIESAFP